MRKWAGWARRLIWARGSGQLLITVLFFSPREFTCILNRGLSSWNPTRFRIREFSGFVLLVFLWRWRPHSEHKNLGHKSGLLISSPDFFLQGRVTMRILGFWVAELGQGLRSARLMQCLLLHDEPGPKVVMCLECEPPTEMCHGISQ